MNAEIIAIGSELLLGQITNTNAQYISKQLANVGINVYYHTVVGDNSVRLSEAIDQAQKRSNLIIFTGGLGPTKDDLTKETITASVGRSLVTDQEALDSIEAYFKRRNRVMTDNNRKQALVIEGSSILRNDHGMAPGMVFKDNGVYYLLLPGPPKEMEPMFMTYALPFLLTQLDESAQIVSRVLNFYGIGESQLETELIDLIEAQTNPTIAPLAKDGEVTIRLTVKHENEVEGAKLLDELEKKILTRVGSFFYGYNETSLTKEVALVFGEKKLRIAAAESITGGLFSSELTQNPGVSEFFVGGVTCYSNEVKQSLLNVPKEVIDEFGAVSEECARFLAENVRELLKTDVGISFTGIAGPTEIEGKEIGTVFIGVSKLGEQTRIYPIKLAGTREQIQGRSVKYGLYCLLKQFS
ncbi:competence/damage-inducible protein A [Anaerobacillus isosaccharinicus]|uniref:Putative competence-damage inducible protein n=1 Tax=Anaerobacillus isosaccharinicus TaxID=1532552 RepID=A0A1S2M8F1_9BACI|nr:competence/damage-inducible protein A [Anaerobacillus isosaccharinicus]MBA5587264.1 competence/damage-inducible protein A [Anaerobacillus isosaccharinicus]QOY34542.1 competence/damage-inducible protein A [Anaerobacillus isosaccharinicus]